ncbi:hypothetical protein Tco_1391630 [Tanacetum coccineum]
MGVLQDLVLIPRESEDTSDSDKEYDLPFCGNSVTFFNPLFDSIDDFTSSNNESLPKKDVQEENFKTYSNPIFEFDEEYISSDVNPLFNEVLEDIERSLLEEFADELALLKPSSPGINKADYDLEEEMRRVERLLYDNSSPRPLEELNSTKSFPPSHIPVEDSDPFMEEIDLFLASDESIPPGIDSDYSDSEGDNLFLERLLHDDPTPLPDIPSPTHVTFPFEDHHDLDFTCVVRVFLPFFTYLVTSSFLLSSGSKDTIFDPGISTFHFSSLKPVAYENPIVIFLFFYFCPKDKGIPLPNFSSLISR